MHSASAINKRSKKTLKYQWELRYLNWLLLALGPQNGQICQGQRASAVGLLRRTAAPDVSERGREAPQQFLIKTLNSQTDCTTWGYEPNRPHKPKPEASREIGFLSAASLSSLLHVVSVSQGDNYWTEHCLVYRVNNSLHISTQEKG